MTRETAISCPEYVIKKKRGVMSLKNNEEDYCNMKPLSWNRLYLEENLSPIRTQWKQVSKRFQSNFLSNCSVNLVSYYF